MSSVSASERNPTPDAVAFRELEQLVRHLVDELAGFRRRALKAEARLREIEGRSGEFATPGDGAEPDDARTNALAAENEALKARLDQASERTRRMLDRVRFLRQQHGAGTEL